MSRAELEATIIEGLYRRIMGHRSNLADTERIVTQIRPLLEAASRQASVQAVFRQMARDEGITTEEAHNRWLALQEADLMLESGGDPDAISVSWAEGVAQWLETTGQGAGLSINLRESRRLTAKITALKRSIAWLEYLQRPGADPNLPDAPQLSPEEIVLRLPKRKAELEMLRAKRRKVDARYDPRQAIFAQTRYLLRLYRRFPSADWLFQAYHGGEGGATRTLKFTLGNAWPGSTASAIRSGNRGSRLSFADVYLNLSPLTKPKAFSYVYGRSDDHRHYWWKLRACQEVIALYRRDPNAFQKEWERLYTGRSRETVWYPSGPENTFREETALATAQQSQKLVSVPVSSLFAPAPFARPLLLPATLGLLRLIASTYRQYGGKSLLRIGDMTLTSAESDLLKIKRKLPPKTPPMPPDLDERIVIGGGPPAVFDYHTTGIAFDLILPADIRDRKVLDYAIGYWEDRLVLMRREKKDAGPPRWHIVPNPRYANALTP